MKLFEKRYVYEVRNKYVAVTKEKLDVIETKSFYIMRVHQHKPNPLQSSCDKNSFY